MADKTVTVDTDGTSGTYSNLNAAVDTEVIDLDTQAGNITFECSATTGVADTTTCSIPTGWGESTTYKLIFQGAESIDAKWDTNKWRIESSNYALQTPNEHIILELRDVQLKGGDTSYDYGLHIRDGDVLVHNAVIQHNASNTGSHGIRADAPISNLELVNVLVFNNSTILTGSHSMNLAGDYIYVRNCGVYKGDEGFKSASSGDVTWIKNCWTQGCTTDYSGTWDTADYLLTDSATSTPASTTEYLSKTISFTDATATAWDFTYSSGTAEGVDDGTDLSGTFTDDITGTTRSGTWDLGPSEYTSGYADGTANVTATGDIGEDDGSALVGTTGSITASGAIGEDDGSAYAQTTGTVTAIGAVSDNTGSAYAQTTGDVTASGTTTTTGSALVGTTGGITAGGEVGAVGYTPPQARAGGGGSGIRPVKTRGFSLGFVSDSHTGDSGNTAYFETVLNWMKNYSPKPTYIIHAGDMNESPDHTSFKTWVEGLTGWPDEDITFLPCIGNHDAEEPYDHASDNYEVTPDAPHATIQSRYPQFFQGKEYYSIDYNSVRIIVMNNLTDYLEDRGVDYDPIEERYLSQYYNCNPPGYAHSLNDDHSGFTVADSDQRNWIDSISESDHIWKIGVCHRTLWVPFDGDPRPMNKAGRATLATAIDNGLSIVLQGDVHQGSISGPWYPEETKVDEGGVGAYSCCVAGGYAATRAVDVSVLPGYTSGDTEDEANNPNIYWADAGTTPAQGLTHGMMFSFEGDHCEVEVFRVDSSDTSGTSVHTQTFIANPGA